MEEQTMEVIADNLLLLIEIKFLETGEKIYLEDLNKLIEWYKNGKCHPDTMP